MRDSLALLLEAVVKGDARAATEAYLEMAEAGANANRTGLLADMKAALYEIRKTRLAEVSIGAAFDALASAGSRNGVHNPAEFVLLTRAFVILESMIGHLDPHHDYMASFREQIARLTAQHFAPERIQDKSTQLARDRSAWSSMRLATRAACCAAWPKATWAACRPWRPWVRAPATISSDSRGP